MPLASLAGRFAAKEALIKALGDSTGVHWHDMRVVNDPLGNPGSSCRLDSRDRRGAGHHGDPPVDESRRGHRDRLRGRRIMMREALVDLSAIARNVETLRAAAGGRHHDGHRQGERLRPRRRARSACRARGRGRLARRRRPRRGARAARSGHRGSRARVAARARADLRRRDRRRGRPRRELPRRS